VRVTAMPSARLGGWWASDLLELSADISALESGGRWALALPYDGPAVCARFATWGEGCPYPEARWRGPETAAWTSSLDAHGYETRVERVREAIAAGNVYQANLCRLLSADLPDPSQADVAALGELLAVGNPAPYGGYLDLPEHDVALATASPELFLSITTEEHGRVIRSGPIKGTGRQASDLTDKDAAENVMIVDLVRNDLSRISAVGSVSVPGLLTVEEHPGLVHLVSYVEGILRDDVGWPEIVDATFPPGSVTGAPKLAALSLIDELEPAAREFYCGALGWVDADTGEAELAVTIRTFWKRDGRLFFGTGAGITWGSDPAAEWRETELKAARLIDVAAGAWQADRP